MRRSQRRDGQSDRFGAIARPRHPRSELFEMTRENEGVDVIVFGDQHAQAIEKAARRRRRPRCRWPLLLLNEPREQRRAAHRLHQPAVEVAQRRFAKGASLKGRKQQKHAPRP